MHVSVIPYIDNIFRGSRRRKVNGTQSRDMAAAVRKKKKVGDGYQKMVYYVIMCIESSQAGVGGFRGEVLFDQVKSIA